jgi:hypothetical protein
MLEYLNNVYHDIENDVVEYIGEDFYWLTQFSDTVAFQNSYSLPASGTSTSNGFKKIKNVYVRFDTSDLVSSYVLNANAGSVSTTYSGTAISTEIRPGDLIEVTDDNSVVEIKYIVSINIVSNTFNVDSTWANSITGKSFTVKK